MDEDLSKYLDQPTIKELPEAEYKSPEAEIEEAA
jgi:hypothetical protein